MRYRKTHLLSLKDYSPNRAVPLSVHDLILQAVNREDTERSFTYQKPAMGLVDTLRPSVGLRNMFINAVMQFRP